RAFADPVGVVEQHDRLAALRQIDRQRQPHRPGADHDHRVLGHVSASPILIGVPVIAELGFGLGHAILLAMRSLLARRDAAKLVASATILNPVQPPASTQIGAILANATSGESMARPRSEASTDARKENARDQPTAKAAKKSSRLDLFKFAPFRLNRLAAEVSSALAVEYQARYGLDIPEW